MSSAVAVETEPRVTPSPPDQKVMGKKVPNLLAIRDSEYPTTVMFRVQLEVPVPDKNNEPNRLQQDLKEKSPASLTHAKGLIKSKITGSTDKFNQIVDKAFAANINEVEGPSRGRDPDLVVVQNAKKGKEKDVEFRVHADVPIEDPAEAARLDRDIALKTEGSLRDALEVVKRYSTGVSTDFEQIVDLAFQDNIERLEKGGVTAQQGQGLGYVRWGADEIAEAARGVFKEMLERLQDHPQDQGVKLFPNGVDLIALTLKLGPSIEGSIKVAGDAKAARVVGSESGESVERGNMQ